MYIYSVEEGKYIEDPRHPLTVSKCKKKDVKPYLSVVIPTFLRKKELFRAIRTVVGQRKVRPIEIVVVDDSPGIFTIAELSTLVEDGIIIKYIPNKKRVGAPISRNIGIYNSTAKYIAFLDDDDEWDPEKSIEQLTMFETINEMSLCICYSVDYRFSQIRVSKPPAVVTHKMVIKSFNLSSTSSYMTTRSYLDLVRTDDGHYFDPSLKSGQEYDLAIRLSLHDPIMTIPKPLMIQYAPKGGQISLNWKNKISGIISLYSKYHNEYTILEYIKTVGLIGMFSLGYVLGDRIYKILTPLKEVYERV